MQNQIDDDVDSIDYNTSNDDFNLNDEQSQGRIPFQGLKNKIALDDKDARLFFLSSSYNFLSLFRTSTSTTFIFSTVTSTLTSATIRTCAAAAQFIGGAAAPACRRRRYLEIDALQQHQDHIAVDVNPTQVLP